MVNSPVGGMPPRRDRWNAVAESRVETPSPILCEGLLAEIRNVSRAIADMTAMGIIYFRIVESSGRRILILRARAQKGERLGRCVSTGSGIRI